MCIIFEDPLESIVRARVICRGSGGLPSIVPLKLILNELQESEYLKVQFVPRSLILVISLPFGLSFNQHGGPILLFGIKLLFLLYF
jgi:hypothetical protein